mgnify:CR=1 FL=1
MVNVVEEILAPVEDAHELLTEALISDLSRQPFFRSNQVEHTFSSNTLARSRPAQSICHVDKSLPAFFEAALLVASVNLS